MKYIIAFVTFVIVYNIIFQKYKNPYKLYLIFGKKGSGKSTYLVKLAKKYQKKKYIVYTNMEDMNLPDVRIINPSDLGRFVPEKNSVVLLDECGILFDNREYKNFKQETRDFFVLQRHYKVIVYMCSQSYNVDKKLRDLCDEMYLAQNIGIVWTLIRPIKKTVALTEASAEGESRIAENLKFRPVFDWRFNYIPKYAKYFTSFVAPEKDNIEYKLIEIGKDKTEKKGKNMKFHEYLRACAQYCFMRARAMFNKIVKW